MRHKVGDIVRITVGGKHATGFGEGHEFEVGEEVRIVKVRVKEDDGSPYYHAEYLDVRDSWIIDDNCCEAIEVKKPQVGDKVRIILSGNYGRCGHGFDIGEVVELINYDPSDDTYNAIDSRKVSFWIAPEHFEPIEAGECRDKNPMPKKQDSLEAIVSNAKWRLAVEGEL